MNTRELVLDMLMEIDAGKEYSNILLRQVLDKYDYLETQEKSFIKRITEGTVERQITLDYVLNQYSKTPVSKMKPLIRSLLRMSVYQLLYMDAIPDSAVCNEAVKLAEKRHFFALKGFVNGVLRHIGREKEQIKWPDPKKEWCRALSVKASMPELILKIWEKEYGRERTEKMTDALLEVRPVCVRISERLSLKEQQELLDSWKGAGVVVRASAYDTRAFYLEELDGIQHLAGFAEGKVTVQDVSSMLVIRCADLHSGNFVLDVCAAPGGKSMHAADTLLALEQDKQHGHVEARDVSDYKVQLILENASRMHLTNLQAAVQDACETDPDMLGRADVLLLDVPCSGLGIMGHKRDIKYRINRENLDTLQELQHSIVSTCLPYVKQGGTVIYSTCTIRQEENEEMAQWISEMPGLERQSLDAFLPECLHSEETGRGMLQLFPGEHDCDGFFLARFIKK